MAYDNRNNNGYGQGYYSQQAYGAPQPQQYVPQNRTAAAPAQNNGRKRYSFFSAAVAVRDDGSTYTHAVFCGAVANLREPHITADGQHKTLSFSVGIDNRHEAIARFTGEMPDVDQSGRTWCRVTAWDQTADRLERFLENHPSPVLVVAGNLRVTQYTGNDGMLRKNAELTLRDFELIRDLQPRQNNSRYNQQAYAPAYQAQAPMQNQAPVYQGYYGGSAAASAPAPARTPAPASAQPQAAARGQGRRPAAKQEVPAPAPVNQGNSVPDPAAYQSRSNPFISSGLEAGFNLDMPAPTGTDIGDGFAAGFTAE